jgi:hypothetical protein
MQQRRSFSSAAYLGVCEQAIDSAPSESATSNNSLVLTYTKMFQIKCTQCWMRYTLDTVYILFETYFL